MWVVRKMYWRSGQQYVQAQKIFESREEANAFRKELDFATEIYETNLAAVSYTHLDVYKRQQ